MIVIDRKSLNPVASTHDTVDVVEVYRMFKHNTLPQMEEGRIPYVNFAVIPPGNAFSAHHHGETAEITNSDIGMSEFFFIISGEGIFTGGVESKKVSGGNLIYVPRGEIHKLENTGKDPLEYICWGISTGGGTFVVEEQ